MTRSSDVRVTGPLLPFVGGFIEVLAGRGYSPLSATNQVRLLAHVDCGGFFGQAGYAASCLFSHALRVSSGVVYSSLECIRRRL